MALPEFEDVPFDERPDLTPYLIHLTKNTKAADKFSALDNLTNILQLGKIWGSNKSEGFIRGPHRATCFMASVEKKCQRSADIARLSGVGARGAPRRPGP